MLSDAKFEVIVVGGGHAGCEAASACARLGLSTLLLTQDAKRLAEMSCNPAIGGLAKGHLVKEIDALGGIMGRITDRSSIQSRYLNRSKGPAVWSPRAQCDRRIYTEVMEATLQKTENLTICEDEVVDLIIHGDEAVGVKTGNGGEAFAKRVVLCGGTFWNGLIHIGEWSKPAGRIGESPAVGLSDRLQSYGLRCLRFKTGTPPRLDGKSIDFSVLELQEGDPEPVWFSYPPPEERLKQVPCFLTYSNSRTHEILKNNLNRSPLYTGRINGTGPRYCPSIEDKVVRFANRERHQLFLEPEGLNTDEYYINGFSTSLPEEVQLTALKTVSGLEEVRMNRPGYAVEYDVFPADQLAASLECRIIKSLYLAGQINGTSGYEEAAAQGLMAGINAARSILGKEAVILGRDQAYIGVLIDDLITKIPEEPYRMFTSRAEFRLLLRQDNARQRLISFAKEIGLQDRQVWKDTERSIVLKDEILTELHKAKVTHDDNRVKAADLLKRPEIKLVDLAQNDEFPEMLRTLVRENRESALHAELEIKYQGYLNRQSKQAESFRKLENFKIPDNFDYFAIKALSNEARDVLEKMRPISLGQAQRISGVRASDITVLIVYLKRGRVFS